MKTATKVSLSEIANARRMDAEFWLAVHTLGEYLHIPRNSTEEVRLAGAIDMFSMHPGKMSKRTVFALLEEAITKRGLDPFDTESMHKVRDAVLQNFTPAGECHMFCRYIVEKQGQSVFTNTEDSEGRLIDLAMRRERVEGQWRMLEVAST